MTPLRPSVLLVGLALVLAGCDTAADEPAQVDLAGTYRLTSVAPACDYHTGTEIKTGGTFTASETTGTMVFAADSTVRHDFDIRGTCAFPDGTSYTIGAPAVGVGSYERSGADVRLEHGGVMCTGRLSGRTLTVRTGTLAPPFRFTYELERE